MKIAVDCHPLKGYKTGVGHYLFEILKELISINQNDQFYLYAPIISTDLIKLSENKNVTLRICSTFSFSSIIWGQTTLPRESSIDGVDLLWSTNHLAPIFLSKSIKNIITVHDFVYKIQPATLNMTRRIALHCISKIIFRPNKGFITNSQGTKDKLKRYYNVNADLVITPPLRTQLTHFDEYKISNLLLLDNLLFKKYLLFVGTLEPRKNLKSILETYQKAINLYGIDNCYPLLIVGGKGWKNSSTDKILNQLVQKYPHNVLVKGYINDEELAFYFKGARYFLFPSLYEGYGMPIAEARINGTPIITSNLIEMIEAAENDGIFLNSNNLINELLPYFKIDNNQVIPCLLKKTSYPATIDLSRKLSNFLSNFKL